MPTSSSAAEADAVTAFPRLHIRRMGGGDAQVVMVHGIVTGSHASWLMTSAPAVAQTHGVTLYDLRGHGFSERPESGYTPEHHLGDLHRVTEGLDRFALVGHSFGALLSLRFASRWPERVCGVLCIDPPIGGNLRELDEEDVRPATLRRHGRTLAQTTLAADLASERRVEAQELFGLACPVQVLFGSRSPYSAAADEVGAVIGPENVAVIDGGHSLHVDARDQVTRRILGFLETLPRSGAD